MVAKSKQIAICTGGGDCPGLNTAIRTLTIHATLNHKATVMGIRDGLNGLMTHPTAITKLTIKDVQPIQSWGGTILGTASQGSPFRDKVRGKKALATALSNWKNLDLMGLIVVGGDGTQVMARELSLAGIPIVGIPKTIDNDVIGADETIGFATAVDTASEAASRLQWSAAAHRRLMILEVMGRSSGHLALQTAIACHANAVLIPEIPFSFTKIHHHLASKTMGSWRGGLIVVAEGSAPQGGQSQMQLTASGQTVFGGISHQIARELHLLTGHEVRVTVLGHIQRGGTPNCRDRYLASWLAFEAADRLFAGKHGVVLNSHKGTIKSLPYSKIKDERRKVDLLGSQVRTARAMGISFGD